MPAITNASPFYPLSTATHSCLYTSVCLCCVLYLGVWSRSLQGSNRLQHALQFTALMQLRHVAAASNALLADEHPRDLDSDQYKRNRDATGKHAVIWYTAWCTGCGDTTIYTTRRYTSVCHQRFCCTAIHLRVYQAIMGYVAQIYVNIMWRCTYLSGRLARNWHSCLIIIQIPHLLYALPYWGIFIQKEKKDTYIQW